MNKLLNWFSRKKLLLISFLSTVGFLVLFPRKVFYTIYNTHCFICIDSVKYLQLIFMAWIPVFVLSILFLFVKKEIFEEWKKSLFIYSFIYLLSIAIIPWDVHDALLSINFKVVVAMILSVLYFFVSLGKIIYQSLKKNES